MAEMLSPPKENASEGGRGGGGGGGAVGLAGGGESKYAKAEDGREDILRELAKACKRQGNFHLACKKYTQVRMGDEVKVKVKRQFCIEIIVFGGGGKELPSRVHVCQARKIAPIF